MYLKFKTGIAAMMIGSLLFLPGLAGQPVFASDVEKRIEALEDEIQKLRDEADVRKSLEATQAEKENDDIEALFAAGREYSMLKKNTLGVEYRFNYSYNSYDIITQISSVEQQVDHSLTNSIFVEYGVKDNLAANVSLPFVYKYDRIGTSSEKSVTDLGDISLGVTYQPMKSGGDFPTTLLFGSLIMPTGRSPYDINVGSDISTGNGAWGLSGGASFSQSQDPVVVFGSIFGTYYLPVDDLNQNRGSDVLREVELGPQITGSIGFAYSMSYKFSMNVSYSYTYAMENDYTWQYNGTTTSGSSTRSTLSLGTGWRISPKTSLSFKVAIGLTSDDSDFSFSCRVPFNFDLSKGKQ